MSTYTVPQLKQKIIKSIQGVINDLEEQSCTFWACNGTPENNRIESMVTCSRCQSIIKLNRIIKQLNK